MTDATPTDAPMIKTDFDHCESLYWVFTQRCNDECDHCYNESGPRGAVISTEECLAIVANLPARCDRIILSGGEPFTEREKLYAILAALQERYGDSCQIMLQTNGDLLTPERLDRVLALGVTRIDIASIDRYHKHQGTRRTQLVELFESRGMSGDEQDPLIKRENYVKPKASYGFWGATEDMWLGGNWARGRALQKNIWKRDGDHNFCSILSGGRGFLGGTELPQEISIQLWRINPCCPGTKHPLGDARREKVAEVLARVADSPVYRKLNQGDPYGMGESLGLDRAFGARRARALENICLWCDEFFDKHHTPAGAAVMEV
ncbi:radical SAM protein [Acanthopleuribacter pedis]|uniref:Radical SAM protein n=1 Tax=Acanthopleuribacter pedis TaxID=442870 RepID=A0A8J7U4L2_9BACT|nr:radical SAM protein [Acanthopleuribacter pedis]MBO1319904.1 radical SAM protein [Acanthopleuribacter pedis]